MSRGGFRAAGFMDGFMNGFDFVDRLQRADEERNERRERTAVEDARWQQAYGLRLQAQEDEQAGSLTASERRQWNVASLDDHLEAIGERRRIRREQLPFPRFGLSMNPPESDGYFGSGYLGGTWEDRLP
ncbi:hypothetical protein C3942_07375 [Solimonas fluminis]|uniref:Uncharacterized protein n=1 Tax=Solimonas fluminis TaxID=2086571 RepID=A0A2S5THW1_9GAMM|nr:hypothetical protein [Solimonas fluminis]PPE74574.1 hypothetical protein C3942_07375 [Solimonas fluminis]